MPKTRRITVQFVINDTKNQSLTNQNGYISKYIHKLTDVFSSVRIMTITNEPYTGVINA
jgi:hypothetical protein